MKSHRTIWKFTALIFALAMFVFALRVARSGMERVGAFRQAAIERDTAAATMLGMLERDPRVRRAKTRQAVEQVASYTGTAELETAETFYAQGLWKYYGEHDVDGAEAALRQAIARRPDWAWAHNALGIVLFAAGREDAARAAFEEAMRLAPEWPRPYNDLAILYRRTGRMDDAVAQIERALAMDPDAAISHYNYGVILDVQGDDSGARTQYETVIALDPELPAPHYNLACHYARAGDAETAVGYLAEAVRREAAFREEATRDPDFDRIRGSDAFVAFITPDSAGDNTP